MTEKSFSYYIMLYALELSGSVLNSRVSWHNMNYSQKGMFLFFETNALN